MSADKIVKAPCTNCGGEPKNHDVVRAYEDPWHNDASGEHGKTVYQICKCRGCGCLRFRESSWSSDDIDPSTGDAEPTITIYPNASKSDRTPIESHDLPDAVQRIYVETIAAFNAGALTLAGGGLRAIVEAICIDQNVSGGNLQRKIDDLVKKELLAKPQADLLHEERYIGNAALHEILALPKQEVEDGLAIVEGLLNTIYVLPLRAQSLRRKREKRRQRQDDEEGGEGALASVRSAAVVGVEECGDGAVGADTTLRTRWTYS